MRIMSPRLHTFLAAFLLLPALASCGEGPNGKQKEELDPMIAAALADPLMTDPDLSTQNRAALALTGDGVPSTLIPTEEHGEEVRAAALADAATLLGAEPRHVPPATGKDGALAAQTALLSWQAAFPGNGCAGKAVWNFGWAAQMPPSLPVYPRGHVQEAAGLEQGPCRLRAINFRTAVAPQDVIAFYAASGGKAGFALNHVADGEAHAIKGSKGASGFAVYARPGSEGMTDVDLVTSGS